MVGPDRPGDRHRGAGRQAGATFVAATTTALAHVEPDRAGVASGVVNTFHELGGVASIAAGSIAPGAATSGFVNGLVFLAITAAAVATIAAVLVPGERRRPPHALNASDAVASDGW